MNDEELGLLAAVIAGVITLAFAWWCKVARVPHHGRVLR